jgi:phage major head subunit gpT-like protein
MFINHANLAELFVGYKTLFRGGFDLVSPLWKSIAMEVPSSTEVERYDWLGDAPGMSEWLTDRTIHSLRSHGFTIRNRDFELTIGVERKKIEDDQQGIYAPWMTRAGESAAQHPDELLFSLLDAGRTTLGYDAVNFFSTLHPYDPNAQRNGVPLTGTQSNVNTGGSGPYWYLANLSSSLRPMIFQMRKRPEFVSKMALTDDNVFFEREYLMGVDARYNVGFGLWQQMYASNRPLTAEWLEAAIEAGSSLYTPEGKPMAQRFTHLIVPTTLEWDAKRLLNSSVVLASDGVVGTAAVDNLMKGAVQLIVAPYLART